MWTILLAGALADGSSPDPDVSETVIVYADPIGAWDNTRWLVEVSSDAVDMVSTFRQKDVSFVSPQWQVRAVLDCAIEKRGARSGIVTCGIETVSLVVTTEAHWQRASDRADVDAVVRQTAEELRGAKLRLRIDETGDVLVVDDALGTNSPAIEMLRIGLDGFQQQAPRGGYRDGATWTSLEEPLMDLKMGMETYGLEEAVHLSNLYRGELVVQTLARKGGSIVVGLKDDTGSWEAESLGPGRVVEEGFKKMPIEIRRPIALEMHAVGLVDRTRGCLRERVWSVTAPRVQRDGAFRLLGDDEQVVLPPSGQVAPPGVIREGVAFWRSLAVR